MQQKFAPTQASGLSTQYKPFSALRWTPKLASQGRHCKYFLRKKFNRKHCRFPLRNVVARGNDPSPRCPAEHAPRCSAHCPRVQRAKYHQDGGNPFATISVPRVAFQSQRERETTPSPPSPLPASGEG